MAARYWNSCCNLKIRITICLPIFERRLKCKKSINGKIATDIITINVLYNHICYHHKITNDKMVAGIKKLL